MRPETFTVDGIHHTNIVIEMIDPRWLRSRCRRHPDPR